ncbi:unnamed protein product [Lactuca virosa]|uniref:ABC transporter A family member 2/9/11 C-terminal domain-containing protein n=1 Tax=Lactuca virosa TaxID=75947 RepID=A0AAU9NYF7_9ASTR|nr:unnamed protein product [Lactuca virosa]
MKLNKGLKKSETKFMTTLEEEDVHWKMDAPKENNNMTSLELHKKSHLRRKMEHVMEKLDKAKKKKNTLIRKSKVEFLNRATSKLDEQINKGSRHNMLILWKFSKACKRDNSHAYKFLKGRHKKLHKTVQQSQEQYYAARKCNHECRCQLRKQYTKQRLQQLRKNQACGREKVLKEEVNMRQIKTDKQIAKLFTKGLSKGKSEEFGISDIQLSLATLEEVFLNIAKQAEFESAAAEGRFTTLTLTSGTSLQIPIGARYIGIPETTTTENPRGVMVEVYWGQDDTGALCISGHSNETPIPSHVQLPDVFSHSSRRNFLGRSGPVHGIVINPN